MELERSLGTIKAHGYGVCSITYDTVEILRDFARRRGITFPMLADPASAIIRRFGLFNEQVEPGSRDHGMSHPGIFLVDPGGIVRERFFEEHYWNRPTTPAIFWRLGRDFAQEIAAWDGEHVRVRASVTDPSVYPGNRFTLFVTVEPRPGVHVYAPDVGGGYQGLEVRVDAQPYVHPHPPQYPEAARLRLPWTDEHLAGYTGPARVAVDISLGTRLELAPVLEAGGRLTITGTLLLQACDERVCWPPESLPIVWDLQLQSPDLERAPEAIRHKPKTDVTR